MSDNGVPIDGASNWYDSKTFVIVWVFVFFPIGLYGLWKSDKFIKNERFGISIACVMGFFSLGINFSHPLYVFALFPIALVLLWRDKDIDRKLAIKFTLVYPFVLCFALFIAPLQPPFLLF